MRQLLLLVFMLLSFSLFSQTKNADKLLEKGKLLYRMDKGSWYGTDHFLSNFPSKKDSIGGYLSYEDTNNKIRTIFFSRYNPDRILARYEFETIPTETPISIDTIHHQVTEEEKVLIAVRSDTFQRIYKQTNSFYSHYENTSLNIIPYRNERSIDVYVVTAPRTHGVVLIGNDYKLSYSHKGEFQKEEKLHNSLIQLPYASEKGASKIQSTIHSHVKSDLITETDICTLLLYKEYVEWTQHIVVGDKLVSIFDLEKTTLFTMKRKVFEKLYKQEQ
ncbi:hypothetical protein [Flammeovirga sp. SJP92]|uniref:hypothetical protein n=1 Tax=Flammeovirga sp. SJP92 TaxID=1775430 RepID=UPI000786BF66|nr:hypothetical protein [Flammeovirga sp. SJP92]KXX71136.1 hypothetical protein AVL50_09905 [Flammeovirga sp. SJP92]